MFWRRIRRILNLSKHFGVGNALSGVSQHQLAPEMPYPGPSERICPRRRVFPASPGRRGHENGDSGTFRVRECPLHAVSRPGVFSGSRLPRSPYGFIHTALRVQEADFLLNFAAHLESS